MIPTPPTPAELELIKKFWQEEDALNESVSDVSRCIAEIERLRRENDDILREVAKIVTLAQSSPDLDGVTYNVRFTKDMLDRLQQIALSA